jgi:hypothetical protein
MEKLAKAMESGEHREEQPRAINEVLRGHGHDEMARLMGLLVGTPNEGEWCKHGFPKDKCWAVNGGCPKP